MALSAVITFKNGLITSKNGGRNPFLKIYSLKSLSLENLPYKKLHRCNYSSSARKIFNNCTCARIYFYYCSSARKIFFYSKGTIKIFLHCRGAKNDSHIKNRSAYKKLTCI